MVIDSIDPRSEDMENVPGDTYTFSSSVVPESPEFVTDNIPRNNHGDDGSVSKKKDIF